MKHFSDLAHQHPIQILKDWLAYAAKYYPEGDFARAMVLSTSNPNFFLREVSSRVLLLKDIQNGRLIFYTNYKSCKGQVIIRCRRTRAALNFYWPIKPCARQIRLEGIINKTSKKQSDLYWDSRGRESQISQYISKQSALLNSRQVLEQKWAEAEKKWKGQKIPRPAHWGGFAFNPQKIEFWEEGPHRLHNRIRFVKKLFSNQWKTPRQLYP